MLLIAALSSRIWLRSSEDRNSSETLNLLKNTTWPHGNCSSSLFHHVHQTPSTSFAFHRRCFATFSNRVILPASATLSDFLHHASEHFVNSSSWWNTWFTMIQFFGNWFFLTSLTVCRCHGVVWKSWIFHVNQSWEVVKHQWRDYPTL